MSTSWSDDNTTQLSRQQLEELEILMADNPEFAAKLADAIAKKLDEKYGWDQGGMKADLEKLSKEMKLLSGTNRRIERKIDTVSHNLQVMGEKHDLLERKVDRGFERIDRRFEQLDQRFERLESAFAEPAATASGRPLQG